MPVDERANRLDARGHVGEPQRHRLMLDQDASTLDVVARQQGLQGRAERTNCFAIRTGCDGANAPRTH
jgi:hypothetical protein